MATRWDLGLAGLLGGSPLFSWPYTERIHPRSLGKMINLARLHAYKAGEFQLVDVPKEKARFKRLELTREGWIVTHTEIV